MRFSLALPVLATVALAADNGQLIVQNLGTIGTLVKTLNTTVSTLNNDKNGNLPAVLKLRGQSADIVKAFDTAIANAKSSDPISDDNAVNIADAVVNLTPVAQTTLKNLRSKRPAIARAVGGFGDVSLTISDTLKKQLAATQNLEAALVEKLSEFYADVAPSFTAPIIKAFNNTIKFYSACTGKVCLPIIPS